MLVIYDLCVESERLPNEQAFWAEWAPLPEVGQQLSAGKDARWSVAKVERFEAEVAISYLTLSDQPTPLESEWDCNRLKRLYHPTVTHDVFVEILPDRSFRHLGYSTPTHPVMPGQQLIDYQPTNHPTRMQPRQSQWVIDSVKSVSPISPSAFGAVHLCWCVPCELVIAS